MNYSDRVDVACDMRSFAWKVRQNAAYLSEETNDIGESEIEDMERDIVRCFGHVHTSLMNLRLDTRVRTLQNSV